MYRGRLAKKAKAGAPPVSGSMVTYLMRITFPSSWVAVSFL